MLIVFLFCLLKSINAVGQELKDLFYAPPNNTALYLGMLYINDSTSVLCGMREMYLLNKEHLFVDTLKFALGNSFEDNPIVFTLVKNDRIVFSSLNRTLLLQINNGKFFVEKDFILNKKFKKENGNFFSYTIFPEGMLVRRKSKKKNSEEYYFAKLYNNRFNYSYSTNIVPKTEIVTTYRGSEILGFNKIQYLSGKIYIYKRKSNVLWVYDIKHNTTSSIRMPPINSQGELHEFYIDPLSGHFFIFKLIDTGVNKLYSIDLKEKSFTLVKETPYIVRGVFDEKMYVSGTFDDVYGHYLIPIYENNKDVLMLKNENEK